MRFSKTVLLGAALALSMIANAGAATFDIPWRTSDGGGTRVTGGNFAITGTIGQPDAAVVSGGTFAIRGGFWGGRAAVLVAVGDKRTPPASLEFGMPAPNPARGDVTLALALPNAAHVDLSLYDVSGRQIRNLQHGPMAAGEYRLCWDGDDSQGRRGEAGVYFARLIVDGRVVGERKIALIK